MRYESWKRLEEIREEMVGLLDEARLLMREAPDWNYQRAKAYWIAQLEIHLKNDHSYLGGTGCSMEDTVNELEPDCDDEDDC